MKILVDGDACPVKDLIMQAAEEFELDVLLVYSISHYGNTEAYERAEKIMVDNVSQAADMAIINKASNGDIVVTGDYGLASLVLGKKAYAISFSGKIYNEQNIDRLLLERHVSSVIRRGGGKVKGPAKRDKEDDAKFIYSLRKLILKS